MNLPTSFRGLIALLAVVLFLVIFVYASTLGTVVAGGLFLVVVAYLVYLVGYRIDKVLKHGSWR